MLIAIRPHHWQITAGATSGKNITRKSAGLAFKGRRLARQVLGEDRLRQPIIGAAVHDPNRK
jgi:hypothetical protein